MIGVTNIDGRKIFLSANAIASITEASDSSQWHGVRAVIKLFDGRTIECQESAKDIAKFVSGDEGQAHD